MKIRKYAFSALLLACLVSGLLLRGAGLSEPFYFHPDERLIARWMDRMYETHSLLPNCYAGGFFVLADAARKTTEWAVAKPLERAEYFLHLSDRYNPERLDVFAFGHPFNALLGTLAIWLAALLARRATRSRAAALTAAALMAFAPFAIEHAHYLESDVAMLAAVALALYLMVRAIDKRCPYSLALAAFVAGFAAGTKFPLVLLLAPLLASIRFPHPVTSRRRRAGWLAFLVLLAAGLALAGFVVACPDARHAAPFIDGLRHGESSVYGETARLLGANATQPHAREWMNAGLVARFAQSRGAGWLLASAIGLPFCFARRLRPFWPVTLLFPALFLWYLVFKAPWLRSQEFMTLLPNFCLWAALPIAALWGARRRPAAAKTAAVLLFLAAVLPVLHYGIAVSSQFGWEDTRRLANRVLPLSYPADQPLGAELYTGPAEDGVAWRSASIGKYEAADPAFLASNQLAYVLLNADAHGRGVQDPRTGKLFTDYADRMENLLRHGQRLAAWGALDSPAPQPTFRSPRIELWSQPDDRIQPTEDLGAELPRPTLVRDDGRTTFFRGDLRAGPRIALLVDKFPREIAIGGPGDFDGPVFLVFSTHERAATVRADGFGRTGRIELGPYDTGAIALERPWWNPRWERFERVVVRSETGGTTLTYLPCFLRVAFSPREAATLILDDGHPEKAVALLRAHGALASAGPFWQALAGEPAAAEPARALLARWDAWLARGKNDPPAASSGGLPLAVWQDFARIRLTPLKDPVLLGLPPMPGGLRAERRTLPLATLLPVSGARQRLDLDLGRSPDAFGNTNFSELVCFDIDDRTTVARCAFLDLPDPRGGARPFTHASEFLPRLTAPSFRSRSGGTIRVDRAEFSWNWRDMLSVRAAQLRRALAPAPAAGAARYGDWFALRSGRIENGQAVFEFEALQDDAPPVAVQLHILKHRKWRPLGAPVALPRKPDPWPRGERRTVRVPLPPAVSPERIAVALATDVQWHSSLLPCAGASEKRPFPVLADLAARP